jgi:hypothetical protein
MLLFLYLLFRLALVRCLASALWAEYKILAASQTVCIEQIEHRPASSAMDQVRAGFGFNLFWE